MNRNSRAGLVDKMFGEADVAPNTSDLHDRAALDVSERLAKCNSEVARLGVVVYGVAGECRKGFVWFFILEI